ncbi:MAG: sulfatase [Planctomycetota bacterium]
MKRTTTTRALLACAWISVTALASGCGEPGPSRTNVLLVTVDCLRADHVGAYGYERDTTPNIDALARESELFENSWSHAPFTAPSHASLLTSLVTESHGVVFWGNRLVEGVPTMGDCFGEAGWRTGAFHNHPSLVPAGITRGFEKVSVRPFGPYAVTVRDFDRWLDEIDGDAFAAWVHLWDAHRPYGFRNYRGEGAASLRDLRIPAAYDYAEHVFSEPHDERVGRHEGWYNLSREQRSEPFDVGNTKRLAVDSDFRYVEDRYDDAVRVADRGVAELVDALRRRGLLENTVVVVTADHGESLREREECWFTHDPFLRSETLHVPLVVRWPDGRAAGTRRDDLARGIDVLPTLLGACGIAPPETFQGRDLSVRPAEGGERLLSVASTRTHSAKESSRRVDADEWIEHRDSVTDGRLLLVRDNDVDRWSFFDLELDPGARRDLIGPGESATWPDRAIALREAGEAWLGSLPHAELRRSELTPAERKVLEEIGYLSPDRSE